MPYVYVGKRNFFIGKTLWEIVGNLKNFGVGRMLVRSKFERYPEVTYYRIVKAHPLMDEKNLFGRVWVEKVFRGKPIEGIVELSKVAYKNDFKLVPKDEEHIYIQQTKSLEQTLQEKKLLPEFFEFPPLLKAMIQEDQNIAEPLLKAFYVNKETEPVCIEPGKVRENDVIRGNLAPRLYENIKYE